MSTSLNRKIFLLLLMISISATTSYLSAQRLAIKSNALLWATLSPNLGAEVVFSERISVDLSMAFNPFTIKDYRTQFVLIQPKVKYWFGRPLSDHFVGVTALYGANNFFQRKRASGTVLSQETLHGDAMGAGFSYGYNFILTKRWNLELSAGVGAIYSRQFSYDALTQSRPPTSEMCKKWSIAPIDLGVNFVYIIN